MDVRALWDNGKVERLTLNSKEWSLGDDIPKTIHCGPFVFHLVWPERWFYMEVPKHEQA